MQKVQMKFNGFYESNHDYNIDSMLESYFNCDEDDIDYSNYDINYNLIENEYSKNWLSYFNEWLQDEKIISSNLRFKGLYSPKYYNYSTDEIILSVTNKDEKKIISNCTKDDYFLEWLDNETKSYDGYISFYSYDDVLSNKDDVLIQFCLDYLSHIFENEHFENYYDRNDGYELLYSLDGFYSEIKGA